MRKHGVTGQQGWLGTPTEGGLCDGALPSAPSRPETGLEQEVLRTFPDVAVVRTIGETNGKLPCQSTLAPKKKRLSPRCHEHFQDSESEGEQAAATL